MLNRVRENPIKFPLWRVDNDRLYKHVKPQIPELSDMVENWKIVVPKDKRREVLYRCHNLPSSRHVGVFKTFTRIARMYYWPKLRADVIEYIRTCGDCARSKIEQKAPAGFMGKRPEITEPFQALSLDYVGPLPRSKQGHCYILVVSDYFSKSVFLYPCRSANARSLVKVVEEFFLLFGTPNYLMCDNGVQMKSKDFQTLCAKYHTKIFYTANYHPQANPVERHNRVIKTMLRTYVNQENHKTWDDHLAEIGCAIRTSASETTKFSPYFVLFGREHNLFGSDFTTRINKLTKSLSVDYYVMKRQKGFASMYNRVRDRIKHSQTQNAHRYNLRRRPLIFEPGDKVWRRNRVLSDALNYYSAKLAPQYVGPFIVKRKCGSWSYELENNDGSPKGVWHVQDLKAYCSPSLFA